MKFSQLSERDQTFISSLEVQLLKTPDDDYLCNIYNDFMTESGFDLPREYSTSYAIIKFKLHIPSIYCVLDSDRFFKLSYFLTYPVTKIYVLDKQFIKPHFRSNPKYQDEIDIRVKKYFVKGLIDRYKHLDEAYLQYSKEIRSNAEIPVCYTKFRASHLSIKGHS